MPSISSLSAKKSSSLSSRSKSTPFMRKRSCIVGATTTAAIVGLWRGADAFSTLSTISSSPQPGLVTSRQKSASSLSRASRRSRLQPFQIGILLRSVLVADSAELVGDFDPFELSTSLEETVDAKYQSRRALRISLSSAIADALANDSLDWPFPLFGDGTDATGALEGEEEEEDQQQPAFGLWAARGMLVGLAMICGTAYGLTKYIETLSCDGGAGMVDLAACTEDVIPASEVAFVRYSIAAVVSLPLLKDARPDLLLGGLECGLWVAVGYMFQAQALATSVPAGHISFISALVVVAVPLMSSVVFQKPVKPVSAVSAAVALIGVGVLEGLVDMDAVGESLSGMFAKTTTNAAGSLLDEVVATTTQAAKTADSSVDIASTLVEVSQDSSTAASSVASSEESLSVLDAVLSTAPPASSVIDQVVQFGDNAGIGRGDLLALGQPLGFGISFLRIEQYLEKFEHVPNRVAVIAGAQCVAIAVASTLWLLQDFHGTIPDMTYMLEPHHLGTVMWMGILTTAVALYYEGVALKVASATDAALAFASEPVWATLFAAWLLNEKLETNSFVGGAIILSACVLSALADGDNNDHHSEQEKNKSSD